MILRPDAFVILFILIPVFLVLYNRYKKGRKELGKIGGRWKRSDLLDVFIVKWFFTSLLFVLFIVFTVLALAEFTGREQIVEEASPGVDIVFTVDISRSMLAADVNPNRLRRTADVISAVIENLPDERFGLVVFKGTGVKIVPVTEDTSAVSGALPYLSPGMFTSPGTNLSRGLQTALGAFTGGDERKKLLFIFTDGESTEGNPSAVMEKAAESGVDIFIYGAGTVEGIDLYDQSGNPVYNESGDIVLSRLNYSLLSGFAENDNVYYQDLSDPGVVSATLGNIRTYLDSMQVKGRGSSRYRIFLTASVVLLFLLLGVRIVPWKNTF